VQIETELTELGRASLSFAYRISREGNNDVIATGSTKHACIDHAGKISRIPKMVIDALQSAAH